MKSNIKFLYKAYMEGGVYWNIVSNGMLHRLQEIREVKQEYSNQWCVYILAVRDGSFYTGITNNFFSRMRAHDEGKGSKYVRSRLPFDVAYIEKAHDKSSASAREYQIKQLSRKKKDELIKQGTIVCRSCECAMEDSAYSIKMVTFMCPSCIYKGESYV